MSLPFSLPVEVPKWFPMEAPQASSRLSQSTLVAPPLKVSQGELLRSIRDYKVDRIQISSDRKRVVFTEDTYQGPVQAVANILLTDSLLAIINDSGADVVIDQPNSVLNIALSVLPWSVFAVIAYSILRRSTTNPLFPKKIVDEVDLVANVSFDDIAGMDDVKAEVQEIVDFLKFPEKYDRVGARVPRGCLLVGPPGVGKTMLAKAMAYEAQVPFYSCSGSEFIEMFVGMGASRVRDLFEKAKKTTPCIVYIDEIDAVGKKRTISGMFGNDERDQTLNQLLTEMDGFDTNDQVIVLASTNRDDVLDEALLRPGRFDRKIQLRLPNLEEREQIFHRYICERPCKDIDIRKIAQLTRGFSGADIENLVNEASIFAAREHSKFIIMAHFNDALDKLQLGIRVKGMSDEQEWITSVHEMGHVMAALFLTKVYDDLHKVSIEARGNTGGVTIFLPRDEVGMVSKQYLSDSILVAMGGHAAEEVMFGKWQVTTGAIGDIETATQTARSMATRFGFSESLGKVSWDPSESSERYGTLIDHTVFEIISERYQIVLQMLEKRQNLLEHLAKVLKERKTMTSEDIQECIEEFQEN